MKQSTNNFVLSCTITLRLNEFFNYSYFAFYQTNYEWRHTICSFSKQVNFSTSIAISFDVWILRVRDRYWSSHIPIAIVVSSINWTWSFTFLLLFTCNKRLSYLHFRQSFTTSISQCSASTIHHYGCQRKRLTSSPSSSLYDSFLGVNVLTLMICLSSSLPLCNYNIKMYS